MIGELLGNRYEIIEKVGGGGMALVYKARCRLLNRFVAVKVLRYELIEDQEFVRRFNVEAQAAASLSHPNIVSIYDVGQQGNTYYIVMEYVDGITLKQMIDQRGPLPWREALNISAQICSALEHAHKNNIVHRDIKPHNIIISQDGRVKVTDFGIARAVTSSTVTLGGNTIGSVHYFSPEQARGGYTDEKSDIYSLGIVMYEMLTGKVPFDGESPVSIAIKHIHDMPEPPRNKNKDIPIVVQSIILKAINKEQSSRYASARTMRLDIYRAIESPDENFIDMEDIDDCPTRKIPIITDGNGSENMAKRKSKKKMKREDRVAVIAAIITSIIIIAGVAFAAYTVFGDYIIQSEEKEKAVPRLVGKNFNSVKDLYKDSKFNIVETRREYNEEYEEGLIIQQSPVENMPVKLPATIEVIVSSGAKMIKVPNVINKEYRQAEIELDQKDLRYIVQYEHHDRIPEGIVIRHEPGALVDVKVGSLVRLYVSNGPDIKMVKMPDLRGRTESEAKQIIGQKNLVLGDTKSEKSDSPKNTVIFQSIEPDQEVQEKTVVDIVISEGKQISEGKPVISEKEQPVREQTITIRLPKKRESMEVKVVSISNTGTKVLYRHMHTSNESPLDIKLSGKGTVYIQVYIDDKIIGENTINFGGEAE